MVLMHACSWAKHVFSIHVHSFCVLLAAMANKGGEIREKREKKAKKEKTKTGKKRNARKKRKAEKKKLQLWRSQGKAERIQ